MSTVILRKWQLRFGLNSRSVSLKKKKHLMVLFPLLSVSSSFLFMHFLSVFLLLFARLIVSLVTDAQPSMM